MGEFKTMLVQAEIVDLPAAKKGRYAGKKRHDVLVIRPEGEQEISLDLLPGYAQTMLAEGKRVVMYKTNKAYEGLVQAFFPQDEGGSSEPSIEEIMAEAEEVNRQRDLQSKLSDQRRKAIEAELAKYGLSIAS